MALTQRLDLKQTTSLVMTPQLQMAIQLLQMSNMELSTLIQTELEENPFLELSESSTASDAPSDDREEMDFDAKASEDMDVDYDNTWQEGGGGGSDGGDSLDMMGTLHKEQTLYEYVKEQFLIDVACPRKRLIGSYLIDHLTPAGYLEEPLADIAKGLGAPLKEMEEVLSLIQSCDPPGIGARNLKECLSLQLKEIGELTEDVQAILTHLDELMKGDLKGFSKTCGVQLEIIQEILALIRTLNPRPGAGFDAPLAQTRIPDVIVTPNTTKTGWFVRMNTETIPKVLLNRTYHTHVKKGASGVDDKTFVTEKFMAASWLIKAIDQRMQTILKVSSEIVRQQEAFLNEGIHHLKPLILKDIALAIGMHESTISRVTTNKFMATPRGVFELKYFFTTSLQSNEGEDAHSSELVRHRIKALIENEGVKPLSDDKLVQLLSSEGIQVARRTITKYREALNIPSSFERKKRKALL